jgi:hypothetical protein
LAATPIRGFRQELPPIIKKQLVERHPNLKNMPPKICLEDGLFRMHGDWWEPHCNVYDLNHRLVSARRRRSHIESASEKRDDKQDLCLKTAETQISEDKFLLSISSTKSFPTENEGFSTEIGELKSKLPPPKLWGKTYKEGFVPNWNPSELKIRQKNQEKEKQK